MSVSKYITADTSISFLKKDVLPRVSKTNALLLQDLTNARVKRAELSTLGRGHADESVSIQGFAIHSHTFNNSTYGNAGGSKLSVTIIPDIEATNAHISDEADRERGTEIYVRSFISIDDIRSTYVGAYLYSLSRASDAPVMPPEITQAIEHNRMRWPRLEFKVPSRVTAAMAAASVPQHEDEDGQASDATTVVHFSPNRARALFPPITLTPEQTKQLLADSGAPQNLQDLYNSVMQQKKNKAPNARHDGSVLAAIADALKVKALETIATNPSAVDMLNVVVGTYNDEYTPIIPLSKYRGQLLTIKTDPTKVKASAVVFGTFVEFTGVQACYTVQVKGKNAPQVSLTFNCQSSGGLRIIPDRRIDACSLFYRLTEAKQYTRHIDTDNLVNEARLAMSDMPAPSMASPGKPGVAGGSNYNKRADIPFGPIYKLYVRPSNDPVHARMQGHDDIWLAYLSNPDGRDSEAGLDDDLGYHKADERRSIANGATGVVPHQCLRIMMQGYMWSEPLMDAQGNITTSEVALKNARKIIVRAPIFDLKELCIENAKAWLAIGGRIASGMDALLLVQAIAKQTESGTLTANAQRLAAISEGSSSQFDRFPIGFIHANVIATAYDARRIYSNIGIPVNFEAACALLQRYGPSPNHVYANGFTRSDFHERNAHCAPNPKVVCLSEFTGSLSQFNTKEWVFCVVGNFSVTKLPGDEDFPLSAIPPKDGGVFFKRSEGIESSFQYEDYVTDNEKNTFFSSNGVPIMSVARRFHVVHSRSTRVNYVFALRTTPWEETETAHGSNTAMEFMKLLSSPATNQLSIEAPPASSSSATSKSRSGGVNTGKPVHAANKNKVGGGTATTHQQQTSYATEAVPDSQMMDDEDPMGRVYTQYEEPDVIPNEDNDNGNGMEVDAGEEEGEAETGDGAEDANGDATGDDGEEDANAVMENGTGQQVDYTNLFAQLDDEVDYNALSTPVKLAEKAAHPARAAPAAAPKQHVQASPAVAVASKPKVKVGTASVQVKKRPASEITSPSNDAKKTAAVSVKKAKTSS